MSTKTPITFLPLKESIYLARPAKATSPIALQAQRINDGSVEPLLDVKPNARPMTRLLKKVRSLNDAVSSIIPDHHISSRKNSGDGTMPSIDRPIVNGSGSKSPSEYKPQKISSFSVFDRDSDERTALAVITRHEIQLNPKATPLLLKSSRLNRFVDYSPHLGGEVTWAMVPEFGNNNKTKITSFKVIDQSTNKVIGRWKRRNTLTIDPDSSENYHSPDEATQSFRSLGTTASNRFYHSDSKATISRPFFSGESYSFTNPEAKRKEEWCFVVTKRYTKYGKATIKRNVVAVLKGFELHIVDPHDTTLRYFYLDEYIRYLRQKSLDCGQELVSASSRSRSQYVEDEEYNEDDEEGGEYAQDEFESFGMTSQTRRNQQQSQSRSNSPPGPLSSVSTFLPGNKKMSHRESTFSESFCRLRVNDGLILMAMSLLLNLDQVIVAGFRNRNLHVDLQSSLVNGTSTFSDNYIPISTSSTQVSPVDTLGANRMTFADPCEEPIRNGAFPEANNKVRKRMHFANPLNVFRKETLPKA